MRKKTRPLGQEDVMQSVMPPFLSKKYTLRKSNIAMENERFEDVFPIKNRDIQLLC